MMFLTGAMKARAAEEQRIIAAAAKRAETVKIAGVSERDRGHMASPAKDIDDLWACISALANRVSELEGRLP